MLQHSRPRRSLLCDHGGLVENFWPVVSGPSGGEGDGSSNTG